MGQGVELALLGILVVFAFLSTLVLSMHLLGYIARRLPPQDEPPPSPPSHPQGIDPAIHLAIAVALAEAHRRRSGTS